MKFATKQFHLGDVLSITTGRLVSPRHMKGVYDILNFMTGDDLFTHQLPRASDECKPYLVKQFPQLTGTEMDSAIATLVDSLNAVTDKARSEEIVADWLAKQVTKYGEMFEVKPIPTNSHKVKDPIEEMMEIMDGREENLVIIKV